MSDALPVQRILMVCMGNICRSPTAEGVLRHKLRLAGLAQRIEVDSAGTHASWHAGEAPDPRSIRHAAKRGYDLTDQRARMVVAADFERFDLILAMDHDNLERLHELCPERHRGKLGLLGDHALMLESGEVPDPYQGTPARFERVLDLVEDACDGLLEQLQGQRPARQRGT
jgi:protein-tyrosine phosphatase